MPRRLTNAKVYELRKRYADGATLEVLAAEVNLSQKSVSRIVRGENYTDAGGPIAATGDGRSRRGRRSGAGATARIGAKPKSEAVHTPLTEQQLDLLEHLIDAMAEHPGHSGSWYARHLGVHRQKLMRVLKGAEDYGYIRREGKGPSTRFWVT